MSPRSTITGGLTLARFLRELDAELAAPVRQAVAEGAEQVAVAVRAATPVKTGRLRDQVKVKPSRSGFSARIGFFRQGKNAMGHIAKWIEWGTAAHPISPRGAGALKLGDGRYAEAVQHPGTRARPFFWRAFRAELRSVQSRIREAVRSAVARSAARR